MKMQYLVITDHGYWGKADTPLQAAKNANVGGSFRNGTMVRIPDTLAEKLHCNDFGGWGYSYTEALMKALNIPVKSGTATEHQWILDAIRDMADFGPCGFVIVKGELRITFKKD